MVLVVLVVVDWPSEEPVDAGILLLGTVVVEVLLVAL